MDSLSVSIAFIRSSHYYPGAHERPKHPHPNVPGQLLKIDDITKERTTRYRIYNVLWMGMGKLHKEKIKIKAKD